MLEENGTNHRTSEYDVMEKETSLVVRRGQEFTVVIIFNRPYDKTKDDVKLLFTTGMFITRDVSTVCTVCTIKIVKYNDYQGQENIIF